MYLKSDRDLYRRRRRIPWFQLLLFMVFLGIVVYITYLFLLRSEASIVVPNTPTPMPTSTPSPVLYVAQAEEAYWEGQMGAAMTAYQRALDVEPNQSEVYLELSRLLTFYGQPERGLLMAKEALRRQPENARAWALVGMAYDWLGLPYEAVRACERARDLAPTLPQVYAYLAEAYIDTGNWFGANEAIATAMELDDTNVDVLRNYGYVLENQGNYYGAIEAYREALEVHPNLPHIYMSIGRNAGALDNLFLARDTYEAAVEIDPSNAAALDRLGWTYLLLGEYDKAQQRLNQALDINPMLADAYGHLATLYFQQRNYEDAIEAYAPAIRYGEARSRRRTVFFLITEETLGAVGDTPSESELARAEFVHPIDFGAPLRGTFEGQGGSPVRGHIRFDVMNGRYEFHLTGVPPVPPDKMYFGWFVPLLTPEQTQVRTQEIFPKSDGTVNISGNTGTVTGPAIENYYMLALCHYFLDDCAKAIPYIETALRIDPNDANALQTLNLCNQ